MSRRSIPELFYTPFIHCSDERLPSNESEGMKHGNIRTVFIVPARAVDMVYAECAAKIDVARCLPRYVCDGGKSPPAAGLLPRSRREARLKMFDTPCGCALMAPCRLSEQVRQAHAAPVRARATPRVMLPCRISILAMQRYAAQSS